MLGSVPTMTVPGDREIEPDFATGRQFAAYSERFQMPGTERCVCVCVWVVVGVDVVGCVCMCVVIGMAWLLLSTVVAWRHC